MILQVRPDNTGLLQDAGGRCMGPDNLGSVALDGVGEVFRALGAPANEECSNMLESGTYPKPYLNPTPILNPMAGFGSRGTRGPQGFPKT